MPKKDSLQMLTPPVSGRVWVESAIASLIAAGMGIFFLVRGEWIPGALLVVAAVAGLSRQVPQLWRLYRERGGSSPPPDD